MKYEPPYAHTTFPSTYRAICSGIIGSLAIQRVSTRTIDVNYLINARLLLSPLWRLEEFGYVQTSTRSLTNFSHD